ncbi:glycogen/starch synthase [Streptomyces collinus]|uniref:glycogen/starch synthase n=1 Tax=Streptomyces collinus TaxID=42684 RepID=UPI0036A51FAF
MRALYITQEYAPLFAEGGLGVTAGSLPAALDDGHDFQHDIIVPYYPWLIRRLGLQTQKLCDLPARTVARVTSDASVHRLLDHGGSCEILLLRADAWYERSGIYRDEFYIPFRDEVERAAFFGWCVAEWAASGKRSYDIVHGTDWQSAAALAHLRERLPRLPQVFSIFNAHYRGELAGKETSSLGLPSRQLVQLLDSAGPRPSLLLAGLQAADAAVTCSVGYAAELLVPSDSDPLVAALRRTGIRGIQLGVDEDLWDPGAPGRASLPFTAATADHGKQANKLALQKHLSLAQDVSLPVVGVCSRLVPEKGTDLLLEALAPLLGHGRLQLVLIGPAVGPISSLLADLVAEGANRHIAHLCSYDQTAAWLTFAGADVTVMPSRVEPGGLNQLIAYRYGTFPVVSPVGGLRDTVVDMREDPTRGTGFVIPEHTARSVRETVVTALDWLGGNAQEVSRARRRVMALDWSWARTAQRYAEVYTDVTAQSS